VVHRRADDPAGQVSVGHGSADLTERVAETGHDAFCGVGEGAVEVEDHQLRLRRRVCHVPIVLDGATCP
jgi:hypothetical protein